MHTTDWEGSALSGSAVVDRADRADRVVKRLDMVL